MHCIGTHSTCVCTPSFLSPEVWDVAQGCVQYSSPIMSCKSYRMLIKSLNHAVLLFFSHVCMYVCMCVCMYHTAVPLMCAAVNADKEMLAIGAADGKVCCEKREASL